MIEPRLNPDLPDWIKDHLIRYLESDGEDGYLWDASDAGGEGMVATLLLSTVGRKSGETLTIPLIFGEIEGGVVVIASKGGAPQHPAWFLNMQANPEVGVQVKAERFKARMRVAEGDERQRLWDMMVSIYAPYEDYQKATDRQIPVVVLERI